MLSISFQQYVLFLNANNLSDRLNGYNRKFNLVENEQVNECCMPGGKVVVCTGILPITKDKVVLAVVIRHEIVHASVQHGTERMNQQWLQVNKEDRLLNFSRLTHLIKPE